MEQTATILIATVIAGQPCSYTKLKHHARAGCKKAG